MDCKRERKRKKELIELRERAAKRDDTTSILSILHPLSRSPSKQHCSAITSVNSHKPTELSLFRRRSQYDEQNRRIGEVELRWNPSYQPEKEPKIF